MYAIILDAALVIAGVAALLIGVFVGFAKQLTAFLSGIVAFVLALLLTSTIMQALVNLEFYGNLATTCAGWFRAEIFITPIADADELAAMFGGGFLSVLGMFAGILFTNMEALGVNTLGELLGFYVLDIIADLIIWIVVYIILKLLFSLFKKLVLKITDAPVIKTLNRIFGALWALLFAYIIVVGVFLTAIEGVFIRFFPNMWYTLAEILSETKIMKFAHDTNVVGSYLAGLCGIVIPSI